MSSRVLVEMLAFWPLAIGVLALIFRRPLVRLLLRNSTLAREPERMRAFGWAILFGALFFATMGLGVSVASYFPAVRTGAIVATLVAAVVLAFLCLWWAVRAARSQG